MKIIFRIFYITLVTFLFSCSSIEEEKDIRSRLSRESEQEYFIREYYTDRLEPESK